MWVENNRDVVIMTLRFGITALEFQEVAKQVVKDGIPDFSQLDVTDLIRDTASKGWNVLELSLDIQPIMPSVITSKTIDDLIDLKKELNLSYSIHLPFWSIELATFNEAVRKGSVHSVIETIELTKPLEPEAYVLHATGDLAADFSSKSYGPDLMQLIDSLLAGFAATSVEEILTQTEINPRTLAIENMQFPFEFIRDVIDDLDTGICFDLAHLLCKFSGTESIMDFYNAHNDRIIEIHLQDDNAEGHDDHIELGKGIMGDDVLREFLLEIIKDEFTGPIIFELSEEEASRSLDYIRKFVPEALG
jgi:sugar phosphate isomerase/epimerase